MAQHAFNEQRAGFRICCRCRRDLTAAVALSSPQLGISKIQKIEKRPAQKSGQNAAGANTNQRPTAVDDRKE